MAQVPTPPASPPAGKLRKTSPETHSPPETLDALLERYLHLLDRHQKLQEELGKQLASGFFSLTQANYSCPPGRRYGEDYYDERMKATRTISISDTPHPSADTATITRTPEDKDPDTDIDLSSLLSLQFQTLSLSEPQSKLKPSNSSPEQEQEDDESNHKPEPTPSSTASKDAKDEKDSDIPTEEDEKEDEEEEEPSKSKPPRNPITWYGILVPPSLRSAQSSFTSAIDGPIPALAAIVIEMQEVERRVEAVRKQSVADD